MFLRTKRMQMTRAMVERLLDLLVNHTAGTILDNTSTIRLYKSGPTPSINSTMDDYTEADYHGYAAVTVATALGPINLPSGEGVHKECDFLVTAGGPTTPQDIKGVLLVDGDGTTLLGVEQFQESVPVANVGDAVSYDLILAPMMVWGGEDGA